MNLGLDGRVAVVTGAASGIGRAIADALVGEGAKVVYADLDLDGARQAAQSPDATALGVDVADSDSVRMLMRDVEAQHQGLDVVVNVAGVQRAGPVTEISEDDWFLQLRVNLGGCFLMTRHAVPLLRSSNAAVIVNVASAAGMKGYAGVSGYAASKGGIIALTRSLAHELAPDGIRVLTLSPGWVDTPFNDPVTAEMGGRASLEQAVNESVPLGRQSTPEEMARAAVFLVSGAASYMTGVNIPVDGGLTT